jgi:hypothetical protein
VAGPVRSAPLNTPRWKVLRFLAGEPSRAEDLRARWTDALAAAAGGAPAGGRPVRVALAVPIELPDLPPTANRGALSGISPDNAPQFATPRPRFAAVDEQWFVDAAGALANDAWLATIDPELCAGSASFAAGSCLVVAEEVVLRGREYLDTRWAVGGERYKMMSFGKRNPRVTLREFSTRWRNEAGRLGPTSIPADVRGLAYVQNHPVPLDGREWPLDAVNEVWFERLEDLGRRVAWFAARQDAALRSGAVRLMSPTETWSMYVRESVLTPPGR